MLPLAHPLLSVNTSMSTLRQPPVSMSIRYAVETCIAQGSRWHGFIVPLHAAALCSIESLEVIGHADLSRGYNKQHSRWSCCLSA